MDDTLQRLLDAEHRAEKMARDAEAAYEERLRETSDEAHHLDEELTSRIPALRDTWIKRSAERAATSIAETERRYGERHEKLRQAAENNETRALDAAFVLLLDPRI